MNEKAQLNAMAEKYKAEMMRLYNKSAPSGKTAKPTSPTKPQMPTTPPEHTPKMTMPEPKKETPPMPESNEPPEMTEKSAPKFPSPSDIMRSENNEDKAVQTIAASPMRAENAAGIPHPHGGNYGFSDDSARSDEIPYPYAQTPPESPNMPYPYEQIPRAQPESTLEPLYTDNAPELNTSSGFLQAEVSTANRAFPIKDASIIVTRKNGDKSELIALLTTDENGRTETIELPAPNIAYSESPDQTQKPFSDYQLAVYARGFYTIPLLNVPIFPTVKSIQPVSMIPLVQFAPGGSTLPQ